MFEQISRLWEGDRDDQRAPRDTATGDEVLAEIVKARGEGPKALATAIHALDAGEREQVMGAVQRKYGNAFAADVTAQMPSGPKESVYQARLDMEGRQEGVLADAHEVANQDVVLEQLAHHGAYGQLDLTKLAAWGYREEGAVQDPEGGFRAVLYTPTEEPADEKAAMTIKAIHGGAKAPPVLAFRGTANARGWADDVNKEGIGKYQFSSNIARIEAMLGAAGGRVVATGHSLGGALAQLCAVSFPGNVSRVVTFQSPGINADDAQKMKAHNDAAAPEDQIHSTHHRAEGDPVAMGGAALTEGDVYTYESVGVGNVMDHGEFPLARLAAARGNLIPGLSGKAGEEEFDRLVRVVHTTADDEKSGFLPKFSEALRKAAHAVMGDEDMDEYVRVWKDVSEMLATGAFTAQYVLAVIHDSDRLTDVQKIKMRDQVKGQAA